MYFYTWTRSEKLGLMSVTLLSQRFPLVKKLKNILIGPFEFVYYLHAIHLPPTSEIRIRFPARPQVGKLVVTCHWLAVYITKLDQLYGLVSFALQTTRHDI